VAPPLDRRYGRYGTSIIGKSQRETEIPLDPARYEVTYRLKVGRCTTSVSGTVSSGLPALRQAARPPTMTKA
jgi:hypothetical protein